VACSACAHYYEAIKRMLRHLTVVFWVYCIIAFLLTSENSGFWYHIDDTFPLQECYTAHAGNCLRMFWDSLSAPSSRIKQPNKNAGQQMEPLILGVGRWGASQVAGVWSCCHDAIREKKLNEAQERDISVRVKKMKKCEVSQELHWSKWGKKAEIKRSTAMRDTRLSEEAKKWCRHGMKEVKKWGNGERHRNWGTPKLK